MRSTEAEVPKEQRDLSRSKARRFYQLALQYAVAGSKPLVVIMMGRVGTGKSMHAQALGEALGWPIISADRIRKEIAGIALYERSDEATRSQLYTHAMTERTYKALYEHALRHTRQNRQGTILDATYSNPQHRAALREALRRHNIPHCFVEISATDETIRERLRQREHAQEVLSDARLEDFEKLNARYEPPTPLEDAFHFVVSSENTPQDTTLMILKGLIRRLG